jgi:MoxR-like ATPase
MDLHLLEAQLDRFKIRFHIGYPHSRIDKNSCPAADGASNRFA